MSTGDFFSLLLKRAVTSVTRGVIAIGLPVHGVGLGLRVHTQQTQNV